MIHNRATHWRKHFVTRLALLTTFCLGAPAMSQALPEGCFHGSYSAAELATDPNLGVTDLWLSFYRHAGFDYVDIIARMADQAQGQRDGVAGLLLDQNASCRADHADCVVDCDGGSFDILSQDTDGLVIETYHMGLAQGCGAGPGARGSSLHFYQGTAEVTRYVLAPAPADICEAVF